jgi:hypothetical protein
MARRADVQGGVPVVTSDGQRIGTVGDRDEEGFVLEASTYFVPGHRLHWGLVAVVEPEVVFLAEALEPMLRSAPAEAHLAASGEPAYDEFGRMIAPGERPPIVTTRAYDEWKSRH